MKYIYFIVFIYGIKRIGIINKNYFIVFRNKYFNKVVVFILKKVIIILILDILYVGIVGLSLYKDYI